MKNVKPKDCPALLAAGHTYLDVRTTEEFEAAHPTGVFNVPVMTRGPAGMQPNPDFTKVVVAHFAKTTKLVVGCQSGIRSLRACEELAQVGFTEFVNMEGGFGGSRDGEAGWSECGLPTASGNPEGRTYAAILALTKAR